MTIKRLTLVSAILIAALLATASPSDLGSEQTAKSFLRKLDRQDWQGIYAMASAKERRLIGLTERQFVELNQILAEGFPANLKPKFYQTRRVRDDWYTVIFKSEALPLLAPDFNKEIRSSVSSVEVLLVGGRWYPQISSLPIDLLAHRQEPQKQRHQKLLAAMRKAGIPSLILTDPFDPPRRLTQTDLLLVIQGKATLGRTFRRP